MKDRTSKQLQFIAEVVEYLNKKTNQSFKATTKETIQNINGRVNVDRWELEDFKTVIDFKTNEWLKDDKMRQYLCPSTLFRGKQCRKVSTCCKRLEIETKTPTNPTTTATAVPRRETCKRSTCVFRCKTTIWRMTKEQYFQTLHEIQAPLRAQQLVVWGCEKRPWFISVQPRIKTRSSDYH